MKQATPNSLLIKLDLHPPEMVVNQFFMKYVFYTYLEPLLFYRSILFLKACFQKLKSLFFYYKSF
ncbi:MAG: hypothetical protein RIS64_2805 [Bacteroidota bacterium]|jgi:hypothetical protein